MANGGLFGPRPSYGTHSHVSGHEIEHLDKILDEGRTNATLLRTVDGHRSKTGVGKGTVKDPAVPIFGRESVFTRAAIKLG